MAKLKTSWDPFYFFNKHIRPYAESKFADAPMLLLCGSQARQLNGQNLHLPCDTSDFDFVILYDKLPPQYEAAMFATEKLNIPGLKDPVNLDFKIMDLDYLNAHAQYTREVRRFPFLFNMIQDAYPLQDKQQKLPLLKKEAQTFLQRGPAPLPREQIQTLREQIQSFEDALSNTNSNFNTRILAYEAITTLAMAFLRSNLEWESPVGARGLQYLQASRLSGKDVEIAKAYEACLNGNTAPCISLCREVQNQLVALDSTIAANSPPYMPPNYNLVTPTERASSDANGMRIMLDQYIDNLRAGDKKGPYRSIEVKGEFIMQVKQAIAAQTGQKIQFGETGLQAQGPVPFDKDILSDIVHAMEKEDFDYVENLTDIILTPYGGLKFDQLKRVYIDDLHRRRADHQQSSAQNHKKDPWKDLRL